MGEPNTAVYKELTYIESNGSQYINTGFADTNGIVVTYKARWLVAGSTGYIVGSHNPSSPYGRNGGYLHTSSNGNWELGRGEVCPQKATGTDSINKDFVVTFSTIVGDSYLTVDGSKLITSTDTTPVSSLPVLIFYNQYSQAAGTQTTQGRLYYTVIKDHNLNIIRNLIPVQRISDGKNGLYDTVSNAFFTDVNGGNFIAGAYKYIKKGDVFNFPYTGDVRQIKLTTGTYQLECWGAGSKNVNYPSVTSKGGYSIGTLTIPKNQEYTLYCCVGGVGYCYATRAGIDMPGGYNGGGGATTYGTSNYYSFGTPGGGATHIGFKSGLLTTFASDYSSQLLMVAGGSGGTGVGKYPSSTIAVPGGNGGGTSGAQGNDVEVRSSAIQKGGGGSQSAGGTGFKYNAGLFGTFQMGDPGAFGQGGKTMLEKDVNAWGHSEIASLGVSLKNSPGISAGGGGFYGGGGGSTGGGGSGYINPSLLTDGSTIQESISTNPDPELNGYIRIIVLSSPITGFYKLNSTTWKQIIAGYYKISANTWKPITACRHKLQDGWHESIYSPIDYLKSTGTQYIDTGVKGITGIEITFKTDDPTVTQTIFGGVESDGTGTQRIFLMNYVASAPGNWHWAPAGGSYGPPDGNKHTFIWKENGDVYLGNTKIGSNNIGGNDQYNIFLFAKNYGGTANQFYGGNIYSCKLYKNGSLVRDLIPVVRNKDRKPGMLDLVGGGFYTNRGSGEFGTPA